MTDKMYSCKFCGGKSKTYANFVKHINMKKHLVNSGKIEKNENINKYSCEICNKNYCSNKSYKTHLMTESHIKKAGECVAEKKDEVVVKKPVGRPKKIVEEGGKVESVKRKPGRPRIVKENKPKKPVGRPRLNSMVLDPEFINSINTELKELVVKK